MSNSFIAPHFQSPEAAREWLEKLRWPEGPVCSHCGVINHAYRTKKPGWYRCAEKDCRKDFTVTTGTVMERSHIPLNKWLMAFYLLNASKKGMSAHQLHRALNLDYKSAWFMCHRIREAMRSGGLGPLGGEGKIVEADETYYGPVDKAKVRTKTTSGRPYTRGSKTGRGSANKRPIVALVERGGNVRTFHVPVADQATVEKIVGDNIARESRLHTDESRLYFNAADTFTAHETVHHTSGEYVRYEDGRAIHTNSAEGYFSIFKRGMRGVYQHCKEKHLHRYLAEFDHRYNHRVALGYSDIDRTLAAIKGIEGKRLMYRQPH
ncbi:MAG: IS1595 family transposase [Xanthobacteraceae bacterium]|jgi:transposase-like protein